MNLQILINTSPKGNWIDSSTDVLAKTSLMSELQTIGGRCVKRSLDGYTQDDVYDNIDDEFKYLGRKIKGHTYSESVYKSKKPGYPTLLSL